MGLGQKMHSETTVTISMHNVVEGQFIIYHIHTTLVLILIKPLLRSIQEI